MFNIFKSKKEENNQPDWLPELQETQDRWFVFLGKLEDKMSELCEAAVPELTQLFNSGDDANFMAYNRMSSGVLGQLDNIREKASDAYGEKIINFYDNIKSEVNFRSPYYDLLGDFRTKCSDRYNNDFEKKYSKYRKQIKNTEKQDYEVKYQEILTEYENIKNGFACKQCGSGLLIDKIFFINTLITCPSCQTQNTFEPSSQARNMQSIAFNLSEQRVKHLYKSYKHLISQERELYHERHKLKLSATFEKDKNIKAEKEQQVIELTNKRQVAIDDAPELYYIYLRAKYDEMNKILPDLKEHNEVRYQNDLDSFNSNI